MLANSRVEWVTPCSQPTKFRKPGLSHVVMVSLSRMDVCTALDGSMSIGHARCCHQLVRSAKPLPRSVLSFQTQTSPPSHVGVTPTHSSSWRRGNRCPMHCPHESSLLNQPSSTHDLSPPNRPPISQKSPIHFPQQSRHETCTAPARNGNPTPAKEDQWLIPSKDSFLAAFQPGRCHIGQSFPPFVSSGPVSHGACRQLMWQSICGYH
jgi:hypothetical protein